MNELKPFDKLFPAEQSVIRAQVYPALPEQQNQLSPPPQVLPPHVQAIVDAEKATPTDITDLSPEFLTQLKLLVSLPDSNEAKMMIQKIILQNPSKPPEKRKIKGGPYYREDFAKMMIPILERMDKEKKSIQIDMKKYPKYSINTVVARFSQSMSYLCEQMDESGDWKRIRKTFEIRTSNHRLILFYRGEAAEVMMDFEFEDYRDGASFVDIRKEVENFIENGKNGEQMEIPRKANPQASIKAFDYFIMSEEEVGIIEELCAPCEAFGMFHKIDKDKVILIKSGKEEEVKA